MTLQPERRRLKARVFISVCKYLMGRTEEKALLIERTRDNGNKVNHTKFYLNTTLFFCESGHVLEQIAHRGQDMVLGNLLWLTLQWAGCSTRQYQEVLANLKHSVTPIIFPLLHRQKGGILLLILCNRNCYDSLTNQVLELPTSKRHKTV